MCNHYSNHRTLTGWAEAFDDFLGLQLTLPTGGGDNLTYADEVYPKRIGLFARPVDALDPAAGLEPAIGRWGFIPHFHKGPAEAAKVAPNNARSEGMAEAKSMFRGAVVGLGQHRARRCIIPATSFCEHTGPKGTMTKHFISGQEKAPLFLAGLWTRHTWEGEVTDSYTMVMMEALEGDDMKRFHNRQPVALDAAGARTWLDPTEDYAPLLRAQPAGFLAFDPPDPVPA